MDKEFLTLADVNVSGKRVLVRLDLNSPMDPMGKILDSMRFYAHLPTLRSLRKAKVVALANQSRAGKNDFTTMEPHAKLLGRLLGRPVRYVDDILILCDANDVEAIKASANCMEWLKKYFST